MRETLAVILTILQPKSGIKKGAHLGDADCCYQLSDMHRRGVGFPVNWKWSVLDIA